MFHKRLVSGYKPFDSEFACSQDRIDNPNRDTAMEKLDTSAEDDYSR